MSKGFAIIIEGCDKTGKTTLANHLASMLQWPVLKFGQPGPAGAFAECMAAAQEYDGPFIADRFHLGESVYGPIYRKRSGISAVEAKEIEGALHARGALLVLMEDDPSGIVRRFKELDEDFAKETDVPAICDKFEALWLQSHLAKLRFVLRDGLAFAMAHTVGHMFASQRLRELRGLAQ
jgi:hypothetical protein